MTKEPIDSTKVDEEAAKDFAEQLDPGDEMGTGVRHDTLMESRIRVQELEASWQNIYLAMDDMVDDPGEVPEVIGDEVGRMHETSLQFYRFYEILSEELRKREKMSELR